MFVIFFFLFILGLIVGSFLNVVSLRYSPEKGLFNFHNLSGRSRCLHCGKTLRWHELIPVFSFLIQKGQCRSCGAKLNWQYPLVELASGFVFLLPFYLFGHFTFHFSLFTSVVWISVFLIFLLIWTIDYRLYLIPDGLNIGLGIIGIFWILFSGVYGSDSAFLPQGLSRFGEFQGSFFGSYAGLFGLRQNIWINHFAAALIGISIVGLVILLTKGKGMGMGDLKLLAALGLLYGWPDVLFIFIIGTTVGASASVALMLGSARRWGMKSQIPFGPFLTLAAVLAFFFGEQILRGYFNFFGI